MIIISKDKIYHEYMSEGFMVSEDLAQTDFSLSRFFLDIVLVEEDVTVEDVLRHLIDYQEDISYAMEASLGGYPLELFLDELINEVPVEEHLTYAEFFHEVSITDNFIVHTPRFGAVGKDILESSDEEIAYSIELAPISAYKHLPIVLNSNYSVIKTDIVDGKEVETTVMSADKCFTLYEFLHALLFEISYYGPAESRAQTLKEVVASISQDHDSLNLSVAQVEQLKSSEISRLELELIESVANEDYELSAEIRDKISGLKRDQISRNK